MKIADINPVYIRRRIFIISITVKNGVFSKVFFKGFFKVLLRVLFQGLFPTAGFSQD